MLVAPLEMISEVYSSFWTKYLKKVLQFFHCFYQFSINPATIFQYASEADKMKYNIYMMLLSKPVLLPCVSDSFLVGFERIFWFRVATTLSFISLRKNVRQVQVNNVCGMHFYNTNICFAINNFNTDFKCNSSSQLENWRVLKTMYIVWQKKT